MSFECAKKFVSEMKSNKDLRGILSQFNQSESLKNFMRDKGFDFNDCDLVQAMSSCMEEMATTDCSATKSATEKEPVTDETIKTLIAISAATAANCIPCFEHYYFKASALSLTNQQIQEAVDIASKVKIGASMAIKDTINELMTGEKEPEAKECCVAAAQSSCC
jgi:predicted ribosomally synthesized peptide with nif11-like leader